VTEQLNGPKVKVEFPSSISDGTGTGDKPISFDDWLTLLDQGITMKKSEESAPSFEVVSEINPQPQPSLHQSFCDQFFHLPPKIAKSYHLQANASTVTIGSMINTMCQMLHQHNAQSDVRVYSREEFSLRLPCRFLFGQVLEKTVRSLSSPGLKVYLHKGNSLGYYLGGSNTFGTCPTITGTIHQIQAVLGGIPEEMMLTYFDHWSTEISSFNWCSLRVCAPRPDTLNRLVRAAKACEDNPNTLGVDVRSKAFFAVKTVKDMKLLLGGMINGGGVADDAADEVPTLVILGQPRGVF